MTDLSQTDSDSNIDLIIDLASKCFPDNQVLADLTAVQAILESGLRDAPPSQLAWKYNNLFGIKGLGTGKVINGKLQNRISLPTHEYSPANGWVEVDQGFAVNATIEDSLEQHKQLLNRPRYLSVLQAKTFVEAATQIRQDGYATDPHYSQLLIDIYNEYIEE